MAKPKPTAARQQPAARKQPPARRPATARQPAAARTAAPAPAAQIPAAPAPVPPPWPVRRAVQLMYAGAVLSALSLIVTVATLGQAKRLLHASNPALRPAALSADARSLAISSIFVWLITIGVWVVMARTNEAGRGWARIAGTVLCAASTLSFLAYLSEPATAGGKLLLIPLWLAGAGAVVLLWLPASTAYIRAETALARARQS
jgi:hypothetical protein